MLGIDLNFGHACEKDRFHTLVKPHWPFHGIESNRLRRAHGESVVGSLETSGFNEPQGAQEMDRV